MPYSLVWGTFIFSFSAYMLLVFSCSLYFLGMLTDSQSTRISKFHSSFFYLDALAVKSFLMSGALILLLLVISWSGPTVISGFGHLTFSSFERKISFMILLMFLLYNLVSLPSFYLINASSYDLLIVFNQLTYWLIFLFYTSNILSLSFVIEVLTGLITLLLITSVSPSYHSGLSSNSSTYNHWLPSLPTTYLTSLLFFFWTSLVTTLFLYLFLILIYSKFLTLEWCLVDTVSSYLVLTSTLSEISTLSFSWAFILTAIFLKCAITPFFFWKPTFFKGISYLALFFYIFVFYFTIFIYFLHFLMGLFSDVFLFNTLFMLMILLLGTFMVPSILYESLNIKSFFAVSSIMNSLIVLFTTVSHTSCSQLFFL